ncbi:MAG: hypothetical protein H7Y18_02815 [Clostridiaceae bacterium]|nr:hypothetical protein [Clostridiaceae bacterium]
MKRNFLIFTAVLISLMLILTACSTSGFNDKTTKGSSVKTADPTPPVYDFDPVIAKGSFPDIAVDKNGNVHVTYGRMTKLYYKQFDAKTGKWSDEKDLDVKILSAGGFGIERSDPDIVIDSKNNPHIFAGSEYIYFDGSSWKKIRPRTENLRDTELGIDSKDNLYIVHRGGNSPGGAMGLLKLSAGATSWVACPDPDPVLGTRTDHVYPDLYVGKDDTVHIAYRHALPMKTSYMFSKDGGKTWTSEGVSNAEPEAPHIIVNSKNTVYITEGEAYFYTRTAEGKFEREGRAIKSLGRMQPELDIDSKDNIYVACFNGLYNIRTNGTWIGEKVNGIYTGKTLTSHTGAKIGFVEMAGAKDFVYAIWEEGAVNDEKGADATKTDIVVGKIFADGTSKAGFY